MNTPLKLENIYVTVKDGKEKRNILQDISLEINSGDCIGIKGESGSGKSTLLAVAGTLLTPSQGKVFINNDEVTNLSLSKKAQYRRNNISFIFQSPQLHDSLTVLQQVMSNAYLDRFLPLQGEKKKQLQQSAIEILEKIGLGDKLHSYPQELSGGQQSRVGIARSLINNPDILLVDEPTASLDSQRSQEITELILYYTYKYNIATMFVSHSEKQLEQLDKIYTMKDGILT